MLCIRAITASATSGLPKKQLLLGIWRFASFNCPETRMILIGGQRSCTACASFRPSMRPGIWMSVKSNAMSDLDSRIATASSASTASTGVKPASSTISTARMRNSMSSSTTRTTAGAVDSYRINMAGTSNPSESKSVNAIAQRVAVDSRDEIHPRHLFDKHLDRLRQSVVFAAAVVRQQPVGYFLADNGDANVKE